jgi:hypothetical protein
MNAERTKFMLVFCYQQPGQYHDIKQHIKIGSIKNSYS